jgi:hypothetical protein
MKMAVFLVVTPYCLVQLIDVSGMLTASITALMMDAASTSETLVKL